MTVQASLRVGNFVSLILSYIVTVVVVDEGVPWQDPTLFLNIPEVTLMASPESATITLRTECEWMDECACVLWKIYRLF